MQRYSIGIGRKDNDLEAIMGTHYTEEADDEGRYYLASEVDATIAKLKERVKELESEVCIWKATAGAEAEGLESWKTEYQALTARNRELEEALEKIIACGYNKDCLFCGFKDNIAKKARGKG